MTFSFLFPTSLLLPICITIFPQEGRKGNKVQGSSSFHHEIDIEKEKDQDGRKIKNAKKII